MQNQAAPLKPKKKITLRLCILIGVVMVLLSSVAFVASQSISIYQEESYSLNNYFSSLPEMLDFSNLVGNLYSSYQSTIDQATLCDLGLIVDEAYSISDLNLSERQEAIANLNGLCELGSVDELIVATQDGTIYLCSREDTLDQNLVESGIFTPEQWQFLMGDEGTGTTAVIEDDGTEVTAPYLAMEVDGTLWHFHSTLLRSTSAGGELYLISATDATLFDKNYQGLTDFSNSLSVVNTTDTFSVEMGDNTSHSNALKTLTLDYFSEALGDVTFTAAIYSISFQELIPVFWTFLALICVVVLIILYAYFMQQGGRRQLARRLLPFALLGLIAILGVSFFSQTLLDISSAIRQANNNAALTSSVIETNEDLHKSTETTYEKKSVGLARILAALIEDFEDDILSIPNIYTAYRYQTQDEDGNLTPCLDHYGNPVFAIASCMDLQALCDVNSLERITILNANGKAIATTSDDWYYDLNQDTSQQGRELYQTLLRKQPYYYSEDGEDYSSTVAVPIRLFSDNSGNGATQYKKYTDYAALWDLPEEERNIHVEYGLLILETDTQYDHFLTKTGIVSSLLSSMAVAQNTNVVVLGTDFDIGDEDLIQTVKQLSEKGELTPGHVRFLTSGGNSYLLCCARNGKHTTVTVTPVEKVFFYRNTALTVNGIFCAVLLLLLCLLMILLAPKEDLLSRQGMERKRIPGRKPGFSEMYPSEKIGFLCGCAALGIASLFLVRLLLAQTSVLESPVLSYILSGEWVKGFNIFAVSAVCFLALGVALGVQVGKWIMGIIPKALNYRYETFAKLAISVMKYGAFLGTLIVGAGWLGFDTGTVLTGAGIASVVFGLGSKDIISDILSGTFQVFEDVYRVGDIVTMDGFTGTVVNMGLRTTKLMDHGRVKTFTNSRISGVINLTQQLVTVNMDLTFPLTVTMEQAEAILRERCLPLLEKQEEILGEIELNGLKSFDAKGFTLSVSARCTERDRSKVESAMKAIQIELFRENLILPAGK